MTKSLFIQKVSYQYIPKQEAVQINTMLEQTIIRPSNSPWSYLGSNQKSGRFTSGKQKWRVVVDYRKLNEKTIDNRYLLPNITDLLDKLGHYPYSSALELERVSSNRNGRT